MAAWLWQHTHQPLQRACRSAPGDMQSKPLSGRRNRRQGYLRHTVRYGMYIYSICHSGGMCLFMWHTHTHTHSHVLWFVARLRQRLCRQYSHVLGCLRCPLRTYDLCPSFPPPAAARPVADAAKRHARLLQVSCKNIKKKQMENENNVCSLGPARRS